MSSHELKAGDLAELRSPAEILATLDRSGAADGLPFMPEMLEFFGRTFQVEARVERACDTLIWGVRRLPETVMLDDLRCSGQAHAGCQAGCRLYWKEAWLRPASEARPTPAADDESYAELEKLVASNVESDLSTAKEPIYRCQGTDWFAAAEPIGWWNIPSLWREWTCGNVGLWRLTKTMTRAVLFEISCRLRLVPRYQFMEHDPASQPAEMPPSLGFEPGTLVQIRSKNEIAPTLDARGKARGLWFDREMVPFCGKTFPVKRRVERFVDEKTGKLIQLKSDAYILDGVTCSGDLSTGRWFCPRAIYPWWREAWLEPVDENGSAYGVERPATDRARPRKP